MLVYRCHVYLFQMTESDKSFQPRERRGNFLMNKKQSIQFLVAGIMTVLSTSWVSAASGSETDSVSDQKVFELAGVTVEAKRPDWESKLSPGTVTVIETKKFQGEQKDLADILKSVPGVHVRELNGKGQYTVATIRGSTAAQVGVFVDGVMTNLGGDAAVDISTIPIKNVERVEVYRGYIPARFGGTFIGGVINVVTKKPAKAHISAELGKASFGGKSASVEVVAPMKSGSLLFGVNYEKNKGDFPYENLAVKSMPAEKLKQNIEYYVGNDYSEGSIKESEDGISFNESLLIDCDKHKAKALFKQKFFDHQFGGGVLGSYMTGYRKDIRARIFSGSDKDKEFHNMIGIYYDFNTQELKDETGWINFVRSGKLSEYVYKKTMEPIINSISDLKKQWEHEAKDNISPNITKMFNELSTDSDLYKDYYSNIWQGSSNQEANDTKDWFNGLKDAVKEDPSLIDKLPKEVKNLLTGDESLLVKYSMCSDFKESYENENAGDEYFFAKNKKKYSKYYKNIKDNYDKYINDKEKKYMSEHFQKESLAKKHEAEQFTKNLDPETEDGKKELDDMKREAKKGIKVAKLDNDHSKKKAAALLDAERHRMDNDRKNISTIIKWQNARWMVKGSYQYLNRHLPEKLDLDSYYADIFRGTLGAKRQTLKTLDLMVQNRNQNGNLEWGWFIDYQKQKKYFQREDYDKRDEALYASLFRALFGQWSEFDSKKYNIQIDGTYKLSDRQMLDFQANYSHERMDIDGNGMSDILKKFGKSEFAGFDWYDKSSAFQVRNAMEQNILNLQLQDTITLDKKGTWFLTPALRYNQSKLIGRSESPNFYDKPGGWSASFPINPVDTQTDGKGTWQLALKKVVNDNLTFRMAGGTYYRLLNLYEIMGDGCSIIPMPGVNFDKLKKNKDLRDQAIKEGRDPKTIIVEDAAEFAHPESGSQFELSTLWQGKMKHGTAHANLTYFWRTIDNMLTLERTTYYGWSYRNNVSGKVHGFELQTGLSGKHLSLDLELTYLHGKGIEKIIEPGFNGRKILGTYSFPIPYQPEWEGNLRLSWFPNKKVTMFGEIHFQTNYITERSASVDNIRTDEDKKISFETYEPFATIDEVSIHNVHSCAIINVGIKLQPSKVLSMAFGVNDLLDQNSEHWKGSDDYGGCIEYPLPGRNYYATIRYAF